MSSIPLMPQLSLIPIFPQSFITLTDESLQQKVQKYISPLFKMLTNFSHCQVKRNIELGLSRPGDASWEHIKALLETTLNFFRSYSI